MNDVCQEKIYKSSNSWICPSFVQMSVKWLILHSYIFTPQRRITPKFGHLSTSKVFFKQCKRISLNLKLLTWKRTMYMGEWRTNQRAQGIRARLAPSFFVFPRWNSNFILSTFAPGNNVYCSIVLTCFAASASICSLFLLFRISCSNSWRKIEHN